ncbi:dihydrofolate reductase [Allorhodopirellula heiligendammensis]|uniref:Dihydrofolate reductase n=1 Tax=Allorhodopirellula heiligendammensis TaxID=2714739 RepID=A0A5C6BUA8_9BACT|nr:dihydrofolate reductase [Allorhodopirellula heiligendammensis]TWU15071.1 Dihydrofolate reductase type 3 [Allorhodopirellula heiligendammensis]
MLIAIVASTPEGVIGQDQTMPWRLSSDLRRFKQLTMGGTLLMGRKTYDSIGRPLPGRQTWVLTRNPAWQVDGVRTIHNDTDVIAAAATQDIFVVGGGEIYRQWLPLCDEIWWTRVDATLHGDTRVDLPLEEFQIVEQQSFPVTAKDEYPTDWLRLQRSGSGGG